MYALSLSRSISLNEKTVIFVAYERKHKKVMHKCVFYGFVDIGRIHLMILRLFANITHFKAPE